MNFREELNKIIEAKLYGNESIRHQAEFILENILEYFSGKSKEEFSKSGMELEFINSKDKIYVKEYSTIGDEEIFCFGFSYFEVAKEVLCYLESKIISEGFSRTSTLNAREHGIFKVKII